MNKEINYPASCEGCPNNPDSYDLIPENQVINSAKDRVKKLRGDLAGIEFNLDFIKEMGGGEDES